MRRRLRTDYRQRLDGKWNVWRREDYVPQDKWLEAGSQGEWVVVAVCNTPEEARAIWKGMR